MSNNFEHLIPELTKKMSLGFLDELDKHLDFKKTVESDSLLNMSLSVYISSLNQILEAIKQNTIGEIKLINNIDLTREAIINTIKSLPFVNKVEISDNIG